MAKVKHFNIFPSDDAPPALIAVSVEAASGMVSIVQLDDGNDGVIFNPVIWRRMLTVTEPDFFNSLCQKQRDSRGFQFGVEIVVEEDEILGWATDYCLRIRRDDAHLDYPVVEIIATMDDRVFGPVKMWADDLAAIIQAAEAAYDWGTEEYCASALFEVEAFNPPESFWRPTFEEKYRITDDFDDDDLIGILDPEEE